MPGRVSAQTRADTAAVLLDAARQLQGEGQSDAARALLQLLRKRYPETTSATSASQLLSSVAMRAERQESGRVELTVWSTAYGLWLGAATPAMLSSDEPAAYGVGLLAGAPLSFLAARTYLKHNPGLTVGQARALTFGGTWGTWQGAGWMMVLGDRHETFECPDFGDCGVDTEASTESTLAAMIGGGLAGIGTGALLARKPISAGTAATVSASGLWGTWFGLALGTVAGLDNDDLLASTLIGGDATVLAAGVLAPRWNPSVNRVRLVSLSGLVAGVAGGGLVLILQPDDEKVGIGIPLASSVLGLALGSHATRDYDRDHAGGNTQGNALLHFDGDRFHAMVPGVYPKLRLDERGPKPRVQPALAVNLFSARF
jgi:hypothetical protein